MQRDKLQHFGLGGLTSVFSALALLIYQHYGLGPMLAYATTVVGVTYELQQWYRHEGQPDAYDALATAMPGWLAWIILSCI
jgi:hypothetical protein